VTDDDEVVESCALLTVPANPLLAEIDNTTGQMPAILRREDYDTWLRSRVAEASGLLETYPRLGWSVTRWRLTSTISSSTSHG